MTSSSGWWADRVYGLSVRWSLADAPPGTVDKLREYVVGTADRSGNRIPGLAPSRWEGVLTLARGPAFLELSGERMDSIPANDANTLRTPSHGLLELRGGLDARLALAVVAEARGLEERRQLHAR